MRKVVMLHSLAGVHHCFVPGDVVERTHEEAERFIKAGLAKAAADDAEVTAVEPKHVVHTIVGDPRAQDGENLKPKDGADDAAGKDGSPSLETPPARAPAPAVEQPAPAAPKPAPKKTAPKQRAAAKKPAAA